MEGYPPIAEHGLIGDLQTAALVTTDGTIDWWCCPRFDSPSVFASLLDRDNGGRFRIGPDGDDYVARQLYFPDTAILITRFMTPDGVGEVLDFMPVQDPQRASDRHRLVRVVRCVRGQIRFVAECAPVRLRTAGPRAGADRGGCGVPHPDYGADPARRGGRGVAA
jgi:GH15 family glucan-1,4-alpha-glucosidase